MGERESIELAPLAQALLEFEFELAPLAQALHVELK